MGDRQQVHQVQETASLALVVASRLEQVQAANQAPSTLSSWISAGTW